MAGLQAFHNLYYSFMLKCFAITSLHIMFMLSFKKILKLFCTNVTPKPTILLEFFTHILSKVHFDTSCWFLWPPKLSTTNLHSSTSAISKDIKAGWKQTPPNITCSKTAFFYVTFLMKVIQMIFLLYQNSKLIRTYYIQNHIQIWADYFSWFCGVIFHTNRIYKDGFFLSATERLFTMKTPFSFLTRFTQHWMIYFFSLRQQ